MFGSQTSSITTRFTVVDYTIFELEVSAIVYVTVYEPKSLDCAVISVVASAETVEVPLVENVSLL